jgi:hypothetical protein
MRLESWNAQAGEGTSLNKRRPGTEPGASIGTAGLRSPEARMRPGDPGAREHAVAHRIALSRLTVRPASEPCEHLGAAFALSAARQAACIALGGHHMTASGNETWTTERVDLLKSYLDAGLSCRRIACEIGVTRNAVSCCASCFRKPW